MTDLLNTKPEPGEEMELAVHGMSREMDHGLYHRLCSYGLIQLCEGCTEEVGHRVYHPASHMDPYQSITAISKITEMNVQ